DALLAAPALETADLERIGAQIGLDAARARAAVAQHRYRAAIDGDVDLADELGASGTPTFFVNGRRLVGAQPVEKFGTLVDEELAKARALVARGVAPGDVYAELQKGARPGEPLEHKSAPPVTAAHPSRGPAGARVVVQEFGDFQCPFCKRAEDTLTELL